MSNPRLILCGGAAVPGRPRPRHWAQASTHTLRLGNGPSEIHLRLPRLSATLARGFSDIELDLLELAAYVYTADQAAPRGGVIWFEYGQRWRRQFRFEIPVRRPDIWADPTVRRCLEETLGFLSDDDYEFVFTHLNNPPPAERYLFDEQSAADGRPIEGALLFSGGLDSLCGAVREVIREGRSVVLISHRPAGQVHHRQCEVVQALDTHVPPRGRPLHVSFEVNKGSRLTHDFTQRSRSFLFAATASVVARAFGLSGFRMYENGIVSLNLPISPQVIGARASRTTHPRVLAGYEALFSRVFGETVRVENPFLWQTKAKLLRDLKDGGQGGLCAVTRSCSHTRHATPGWAHCGCCSQCVYRRFSALAAGLSDADDPAAGYDRDLQLGEREGTDLTMVERIVGTAWAMNRLTTPEQFFRTYGESSRVVRHVSGLTPADVAWQIFDLHRRHARDVTGVIDATVRTHSVTIAGRRVAPGSLLGLACRGAVTGAASRPAIPPLAVPVPSAASSKGDRVDCDDETFSVGFRGRRCALGNTREYHFLKRLAEKPGAYVSYEALRQDVWNNLYTTKSAIQRAACKARRRLREIPGLVIDGETKDHYRLIPSEKKVSEKSARRTTKRKRQRSP